MQVHAGAVRNHRRGTRAATDVVHEQDDREADFDQYCVPRSTGQADVLVTGIPFISAVQRAQQGAEPVARAGVGAGLPVSTCTVNAAAREKRRHVMIITHPCTDQASITSSTHPSYIDFVQPSVCPRPRVTRTRLAQQIRRRSSPTDPSLHSRCSAPRQRLSPRAPVFHVVLGRERGRQTLGVAGDRRRRRQRIRSRSCIGWETSPSSMEDALYRAKRAERCCARSHITLLKVPPIVMGDVM